MTTPLTQPNPLGQPLPPRPRRPRGRARAWLIALLVLLLSAATAVGGYQAGAAKSVVPVWDPLWVRAALDHPLDSAAPGPGFWVAGYWVGYDLESLRTLQARAPYLDQVIAFAYGFSPDGTVTGRDPFILRGVVAAPKRVLLFANMADGDFSRDLARTLLTDPQARARSQQEIVRRTAQYGAAGAQLDFEGVPSDLRAQLSSYVTELAAALHQRGLTLSMAVPAKIADSPNSSWSGAFDYTALGTALDEMYVMAYDEHYRLGPPGPIASLPWTEKVIRYAISVVPTKKLVLGVPGYGYDWPSTAQAAAPGGTDGAAGGGSEGARSVASRSADRLLSQTQARIEWDPLMGEDVAVYGTASETHTVWFPDERSLEAKLALAQKYNLKGIALWRLGLEPASYWQPLAAWRALPPDGQEGATPVTAPTPTSP
ncbi:MAG: glycosyl hydrolase family 18 protein [Symbiobacteriia bacterium]